MKTIRVWRFTFFWGNETVWPQGLNKIARNVAQIVFPSKKYFCVAWPSEWQKDQRSMLFHQGLDRR